MDVIAEIARVLSISNPHALTVWWELPYKLQKRLIVFGLAHADERIILKTWYLRRDQHDRPAVTLGSNEGGGLHD